MYDGGVLKRKNREDTSVSLHPLNFEEALKKLTETPHEKPSRQTKSGDRERLLGWWRVLGEGLYLARYRAS